MGLTGLVVFSAVLLVRGAPTRRYTARSTVAVVGPAMSVGQARRMSGTMGAAVHRQMRRRSNHAAPASLAWKVGPVNGHVGLRVQIDATGASPGEACAKSNAAALEALKVGRHGLADIEHAAERRRREWAVDEARHYETRARHSLETLNVGQHASAALLGSTTVVEQTPTGEHLRAPADADPPGEVLSTTAARGAHEHPSGDAVDDGRTRALAAELRTATSRREQAETAVRLAGRPNSTSRWNSQPAQVVGKSSGRPTVATTMWALFVSVGVASLIGVWIVRRGIYRVWTSAHDVAQTIGIPVLAVLSRGTASESQVAAQRRRRALDTWITGCEFGLAIIFVLVLIAGIMGNHASDDFMRDPLAMISQRFTLVSYGIP